MKQAICIQCHTKPEMVNYLIDCMSEESFDFFIHVDKKSDIFDDIVRRNNVFFSERLDVRWGRFSQVEASLALFRMIDTKKYSYIHLISGNDFLTKRPDQIAEKFRNTGLEYIECNPLDDSCTWSWHGRDRYGCYYPQWMIHRPAKKVMRCVRVGYREFIMRTKVLMRKKHPVNCFYGGSSWFTVTGKMTKWMLEYLSNHPEYVDFYRHGICADEVFFSTLAHISPYADKITNRHLRFMKWEGATSGGPHILTEVDTETMIDSETIWARKFDDLRTEQGVFETILQRK